MMSHYFLPFRVIFAPDFLASFKEAAIDCFFECPDISISFMLWAIVFLLLPFSRGIYVSFFTEQYHEKNTYTRRILRHSYNSTKYFYFSIVKTYHERNKIMKTLWFLILILPSMSFSDF